MHMLQGKHLCISLFSVDLNESIALHFGSSSWVQAAGLKTAENLSTCRKSFHGDIPKTLRPWKQDTKPISVKSKILIFIVPQWKSCFSPKNGLLLPVFWLRTAALTSNTSHCKIVVHRNAKHDKCTFTSSMINITSLAALSISTETVPLHPCA